MVSSTFTDLKEHRTALIKAIKGQGLTDVAMENDSAKPDLDVIDSSLQMVRDSSAYISVISRKYGQTPKCKKRNPDNLSITELEFNEAQRLNRPILLFIMGEKHPILEEDVETNAVKRKKLKAFRERAKQIGPDSPLNRVYATFDGLEEFTQKAIHAIANLRRFLESQAYVPTQHSHELDTAKSNLIPTPPDLYAEPPYIGSHEFLGRKAQLETLSDWASPADTHPILLFEAIGGTGKSLLTWEWATKHATKVREDWAGRFWYSFYERGAIMTDFCRRALAYITGQPLASFQKKKTAVLGDLLLRHLQANPWLLILDGLERVLVAYHRFDAAQLADEEAGTTDQIAHRDPCAAIRPEDDDLLRALAVAAPSKIIITSRLIPRVLLNTASQPIPGVLRVPLPGLRPTDAEALLRTCGVSGDSKEMQNYLKSHCDCHPLVIGVLAGLINDYLPDRGDFDAWAAAPNGGGQLNLANLDLVQKRNHILHIALNALPPKSRQLLSTLALLSEAVDYPTVSALNPHLPTEIKEVEIPVKPENTWRWERMSDEEKVLALGNYQEALKHYQEYERALNVRLQSSEFFTAPQELAKTVRDLERRGLLQYDTHAKRYDLHPVVRADAERSYARFCLYRGKLTEDYLTQVEKLSIAAKNRSAIHELYFLRGEWRIEQSQWALAVDSFREAVRMTRELGHETPTSGARLALAKFYLNQLLNPYDEAEQLEAFRDSDHLALAELWLAIGDTNKAEKHAIAAYKEAWADGEPYVWRYQLTKARTLLNKLNLEVPNMPPYDPVKDEKLPWEDKLDAAIEELRAEKENKELDKRT
jgi:hypothetical protein